MDSEPLDMPPFCGGLQNMQSTYVWHYLKSAIYEFSMKVFLHKRKIFVNPTKSKNFLFFLVEVVEFRQYSSTSQQPTILRKTPSEQFLRNPKDHMTWILV
jgi:hypothetical protein